MMAWLVMAMLNVTLWAQSPAESALGTMNPFPERFFHLKTRGSLTNSLLKFERGGEATVAFLGGSITEMEGWHNMIMDYLTKRFPQTKFQFIEAGIPSMGSTPHAFRMEHDVLSRGRVNLLFFEAVVNDDGNGFTPSEQVKGVEGVVRHAWQTNPETDIVMMYFVQPHYGQMVAQGQLPDVVLNHERVANYYLVPAVDMVSEMGERVMVGELTWKDFGGIHPAPLGQRYYATSIIRLMNQMWSNRPQAEEVKPHKIPGRPLDEFCYNEGHFVDIRQARLMRGWEVVDSWHPDDEASTRPGFVDVPMLETTKAGARLTLDFVGRAVGICCVAGPSAGILEYRVDGGPWKRRDTFTGWSSALYIPWVYMMETELADGPHKLEMKMSAEKNKNSHGTACQIRNFVVNGK